MKISDLHSDKFSRMSEVELRGAATRQLSVIFPGIRSEVPSRDGSGRLFVADLKAPLQDGRSIVFEVKQPRPGFVLGFSEISSMLRMRSAWNLQEPAAIFVLLTGAPVAPSVRQALALERVPIAVVGASTDATRMNLREAFALCDLQVPELN